MYADSMMADMRRYSDYSGVVALLSSLHSFHSYGDAFPSRILLIRTIHWTTLSVIDSAFELLMIQGSIQLESVVPSNTGCC